jgi:HSP20 family molecular chaperone IbpA
MTNTAITLHRPSLLGRSVFDDAFDSFFTDFPTLLRQTTQGYPVSDIYQNEGGDTVMEFALAGFSKKDLSIEVKSEKRSITVRADSKSEEEPSNRRIARRSFEKTYVNFDNNLDFTSISAEFENGLLSIIVPVRPEAEPLTIKIK